MSGSRRDVVWSIYCDFFTIVWFWGRLLGRRVWKDPNFEQALVSVVLDFRSQFGLCWGSTSAPTAQYWTSTGSLDRWNVLVITSKCICSVWGWGSRQWDYFTRGSLLRDIATLKRKKKVKRGNDLEIEVSGWIQTVRFLFLQINIVVMWLKMGITMYPVCIIAD